MMQEMKGKATDRQKTQEESMNGRRNEWVVDREELEKLEKLEKEREGRMHGVMEPIQRETGDLQDEDVIVGLLGITHL